MERDFSMGSVPRTILRLSGPMIGAQVVNVTYSVVDRVYLGRMPEIGGAALAGVGLTFPILTLISAFAALAGEGGAPLLSIARGAGDRQGAEKLMSNSLILVLLFGILLTAFGHALMNPLLRAFGASEGTFGYASEYLRIYLSGSILVMLVTGMCPYIGAMGDARRAMAAILTGATANIALDPILIYALGLGVRGAAWATVISQGLSAGYALRYLAGGRGGLRLRLARPDRKTLSRICALGLSSFTMKVTESAVQIVCNAQLSRYGGDLYVTVMAAMNSIRQVILMVFSGLSQGASPVIGYNYGAGLYSRVRKAVGFLTAACAGYAAIAWAAAMAFPEALLRAFNGEAGVLAAGIPSVRIYFSLFFFLSLQMAGQHGFVALGKARQAIGFSLLRKAAIVIPLAMTLPHRYGARGVFLAEPISDLIGSAACFATFYLTVWRRELRAPDAPRA